MIVLLDHTQPQTSEEIYHLFQASYQIEADMVGAKVFPPLQRSAGQIANSTTKFYGWLEGKDLAGAVELAVEEDELHINSLVVAPNHFRKGIGRRLLEFSFKNHSEPRALVETAAVNQPAIALYERMGFKIELTYMTEVGIEKVRLKKG